MKTRVSIGDRDGELEYRCHGTDYEFTWNGGPSLTASVVEVEPGIYSVLVETQSHEVKVVRGAGSLFVDLDGSHLEVRILDPRDEIPSNRSTVTGARGEITAPMPGKVVRLLAGVGDAVEAGQGIVVVEAMKMQNEMQAPRAGRVVEITVQPGATVDAGQMLAVIE